MSTRKKKGNKLEDALELIESHIQSLKQNGKGKIRITRNKIVPPKHRYELDLLVEVEFEEGTDPLIFIYECKNWASAVGESEVLFLWQKVNELKATKGFIAGTNFSVHAKNEAKRRNIELIDVTEIEPLKELDQTVTTISVKNISYSTESNPRMDKVMSMDDYVICGGVQEQLRDLIKRAFERFQNENYLKDFLIKTKKEGAASISIPTEINCNPVIIKGEQYSEFRVLMNVDFEIYYGEVQFEFDLQRRGKAIKYEVKVPNRQPLTIKMSLRREDHVVVVDGTRYSFTDISDDIHGVVGYEIYGPEYLGKLMRVEKKGVAVWELEDGAINGGVLEIIIDEVKKFRPH